MITSSPPNTSTDSTESTVPNGLRAQLTNSQKTRNAQGDIELTFDVSWPTSWRDPEGSPRGNWNALWIVCKARFPEMVATLPAPLEAVVGAVSALGAVAALLKSKLQLPGTKVEVEQHSVGGWTAHHTFDRDLGPGVKASFTNDLTATLDADGSTVTVTHQSRRHHVWLSGDSSDHTAPPGAVIRAMQDGAGVFLYRSADNAGTGPVTFSGVKLRVGASAIAWTNLDHIELELFTTEMVYIPEGPFQLGDPGANPSSGSLSCFHDPLTSSTYEVTSEDAIRVSKVGPPPVLWYENEGHIGSPGTRQDIPAAFPKGHRAFYVMEHQISQGEYAEFLTSILHVSPNDATSFPYFQWFLLHYPYLNNYLRYTVSFHSRSQRCIAAAPELANNWMAWSDGAAFAAWYCLRPMTELEYEKACRGPAPAVASELAWGTTELIQATEVHTGADGGQVGNGNCCYGNFDLAGQDGAVGGWGPLPSAGFLAPQHEPSSRVSTGASYYGVMGLSGNLWDLCVSAGNPEGLGFTGKPGDGKLVASIDMNNGGHDAELLWPPPTGVGVAFRGGSWYVSSVNELRVADRTAGSGVGGYMSRCFDIGFRCAQTAP